MRGVAQVVNHSFVWSPKPMAMDRSLTPAQASVLAAIRRRLDQNEPAPTYRDLCSEFG